jgi:hypothetical protein
MIEIGTILTAKPSFLIEHKIPSQNRRFKVTAYYDRYTGGIESLDGKYARHGTMDFVKDFYNPSNVNLEIMMLLDGDIQFKSFQAVAEDGKVIQVEGR